MCGAGIEIADATSQDASKALQEWRRNHGTYHEPVAAVSHMQGPDGESDGWVPYEVQQPLQGIGFKRGA